MASGVLGGAPPLLVLDTASLYYRSYFALPSSMVAPDGHPHHAVRGLFTTLTRLIERFEPRGVVAAWDDDWRPQWRVDLVPSYKTHRVQDPASSDPSRVRGGTPLEEEPETLGPQIGAIAQILDAWGLPRIGATGFEADDIVATVAHEATAPVVIVTGDRDLIQLVRPGVQVLLTAKGGMDQWPLLDETGVMERVGLPPSRYVEFAVLRGDPSDGLPGVKGIGEKTALALLTAYPSIHDLCTAARGAEPERPLTPRIAAALVDAAEYLDAAMQVTTLRADCPISFELDPPEAPVHPAELAAITDEWGVTRFVDEALEALAVSRSRG